MLVKSRLSIIFLTGTNEKGEPIFKTKSFNNIKETATNEQLTNIANALARLQNYDIDHIERTNIYNL